MTADDLEAELAVFGDPERAAGMKRYLKSDLAFHGVRMGPIRAAAKRVAKGLDGDAAVGLAEELWARTVHERRQAAIEVLCARKAALTPAHLPTVERFVRTSLTWAYVDPLAITVVGALVEGFPDALHPVLDRWVTDPDFWIRRSALLCLLVPLRGGGGDWDRFTRYADALLDEREFFIRKAIGWVLRDTGRKRPQMIDDWIAPRTHRASGVTMREAVKPLPPDRAATLMAAYKAGEPAA